MPALVKPNSPVPEPSCNTPENTLSVALITLTLRVLLLEFSMVPLPVRPPTFKLLAEAAPGRPI